MSTSSLEACSRRAWRRAGDIPLMADAHSVFLDSAQAEVLEAMAWVGVGQVRVEYQ